MSASSIASKVYRVAGLSLGTMRIRGSVLLCAVAISLITLCTTTAFAQQPQSPEQATQPEQNAPQPEAAPAEPAAPAPAEPRARFLFYDRPAIVAPDTPLPPPAEATPRTPSAAGGEEINRYRAALESEQIGGDAWGDGLAEQLMGLGNLQQRQGDHPGAIATFSRAVHVHRINHGLHAVQQVPAVEGMTRSQIALGDWQQADESQDYRYYVQRQAYGDINDRRMIEVLTDIGDWNLQIFTLGYGDVRGIRLSRALAYYSHAAELVRAHFGPADSRFADLQRAVAYSAFLIDRHQVLMRELLLGEHRHAEEILFEVFPTLRRDYVRRGMETGERALQEVVQYYAGEYGSGANASPQLTADYAEALTALADWYLLFEERRAADEHYGRAWEVLGRLSDGQARQQAMFGTVTPLPHYAWDVHGPAQALSAEGAGVLSYAYADLRFDVTDSGGVREVQLLSPITAANEAHKERLQRAVRRSFYRPRLEDGALTASPDNRFRYRYWYLLAD